METRKIESVNCLVFDNLEIIPEHHENYTQLKCTLNAVIKFFPQYSNRNFARMSVRSEGFATSERECIRSAIENFFNGNVFWGEIEFLYSGGMPINRKHVHFIDYNNFRDDKELYSVFEEILKNKKKSDLTVFHLEKD